MRFLVGLILLAAATSCAGDDLVESAIRKTAEGDYAAAESIYRELAAADPIAGLPALARFLALTNQVEKLEACLQGAVADEQLSTELRARVLLSAGRKNVALEFLRTSADREPESALSAARTLYRIGEKTEACRLLLRLTPKLAKTRESARQLLDWPEALAVAPGEFLDVLGPNFAKIRLSGEEVVSRLDQAIFRWLLSPGYWSQRGEILATGADDDGFRRLFASVVQFHEGRLKNADELANGLDSPPATVHRIRVLSALGRTKESSQLAARWLRQSGQKPDDDRICQVAWDAFEAGEFANAELLLHEVDPAALKPEFREKRGLLRLRFAAREGDLAAILAEFRDLAENSANAADFIGPILEICEPAKLAEEIRRQSRVPPAFWLLAAEAERKAGLRAAELESRQRYADALPGNLTAVTGLVSCAVDLAIAEGGRGPVFDLAETHAQTLIRAQPFAPEPMRQLIRLYRETGHPERAAAVPNLLGNTSTNPSVLSQCGYVLATEGFAQQALGYYERALDIDPENRRIRMNRAACLTRLARWDEARAIYRDCVENGHNGQPYHLHECLLRLWSIASEREAETDCLAYFHGLAEKTGPAWKPEIFRELASLMVRYGRMDDAVRFQDALARLDPQTALTGYLTLARSFSAQDDFQRAEQILAKAATTFPNHPQLERSLAGLDAERGNIDGAIARLLRLPEPDAIFDAARLAEESGDAKRARALYARFLDSHSTDAKQRIHAGQRLARP